MEIVEELPLTAADRAAGVTWQGEPIRVLKVEVDGKELLLATDLEIKATIAHWQTPHQAGDGVAPFLSDGPRGVRGSHYLVRFRKPRGRFLE